MAKLLTDNGSGAHSDGQIHASLFEKTAGVFFCRDKQVHLPPQLSILAAGAVEKRPPILWRLLQGSVEQFLRSTPKLPPHLPAPYCLE
jgi:hypothetical protein